MRFPWLLCFSLLLTGCASSRPLYFPSLGNSTNYSRCIPIYTRHIPADVVKAQVAAQSIKDLQATLKQNPTLVDKLMPTTGLITAVGANAPELGSGLASAISAAKGKVSTASVVGGSILGGMKVLGNTRSENATQDRTLVCLPENAEVFQYRDNVSGIEITITSAKALEKNLEEQKRVQAFMQTYAVPTKDESKNV